MRFQNKNKQGGGNTAAQIERMKVIMARKETLAVANDNISVLEAYYTFLTKGTTYELNNGHVTNTYKNGNEQ